MKRSLYTTATSYLTILAFAGAVLLGGCTNTVSGPQVSEKEPVEVRQGQDHNTMGDDDGGGGTTNPQQPHNTSPDEE